MLIKTLQVFTVRGFGAAAAFLLTLLVANVTDAAQAGQFMYGIALIFFFGSIISCGAPNSVLKIVGANNDTNWKLINQDFSFILKLTFVIGVCLTVVTALFGKTISIFIGLPEIAITISFIGFGIIAFSLIELFTHAFQGRHKSILASSVQNVVPPACFILLVGIFYFAQWSLTSISLTIIYILSLFSALTISIVIWFKYQPAHFQIDAKLRPEFKASMSALFIMVIMSQSVQWAGQLATGKYLSTADIAYFASAQRTAMLASFVLIAVNLVVAPKFAQAFANGKLQEVNHLSRLSSRLMLCLAVPVLSVMIIYPEFLMGLFGEEYIFAAPLLQIMAVGQFINVLTGSVGYLLNMTNHEKDMRNVVLFSGPLAIVLAFTLTKYYGLEGAAFATAISVATQNLLAVAMVKKRLGFNTLNIFRKISAD